MTSVPSDRLKCYPTIALNAMSQTLEGVEEMRDSAEEWRIDYDDGTARTTTLAGIAYYAREWDDEATVVEL